MSNQPEKKKFDRKAAQTTYEVPVAKGLEVAYPFQWLLFKPQLHAVTPFETNRSSRLENRSYPELNRGPGSQSPMY